MHSSKTFGRPRTALAWLSTCRKSPNSHSAIGCISKEGNASQNWKVNGAQLPPSSRPRGHALAPSIWHVHLPTRPGHVLVGCCGNAPYIIIQLQLDLALLVHFPFFTMSPSVQAVNTAR